MLKLFIVIYVGTQIGGTIGPLPYGIDECETRVAEMNTQIAEKTRVYVEGDKKLFELARMTRFTCEFRRERPPNNHKG